MIGIVILLLLAKDIQLSIKNNSSKLISYLSISEINVESKNIHENDNNTNYSTKFFNKSEIFMIKNNKSLTLLEESIFDEFLAQSTLKAIILIENEITLISEETFIGKLFEDVILLDVSRNKIQILKSRSLKGLASLRNLSLSHNNLTNIEMNAFGYTLKLVELHFDHNYLTNLPDQLFKRLENLHIIDASYNHFIKVNEGLASSRASHLSLEGNRLIDFIGVIKMESLYYLNLKANSLIELNAFVFTKIDKLAQLSLEQNNLKRLRSRTLLPLVNLLWLTLAQNKLASIPNNLFRKNNMLRFLYLEKNVLKRIESKTFSGLGGKLLLLDLRDNFIDVVEGSAFLNFVSLRYLRLENNNIRRIGEQTYGTLTGVIRISFEGNPLLCDCEMSWLKYRNETFIRALIVVKPSKRNMGGLLRCKGNSGNTSVNKALNSMSCKKGRWFYI